MNTLNIEFSTACTLTIIIIANKILNFEFIKTRLNMYMYVKYGSLGITMSAYSFGKFSDSLELRIKWSFPNSNLDEYQVRYEIGNPNIDKFRVAESLNVHVQLIPRATSPSWRWS